MNNDISESRLKEIEIEIIGDAQVYLKKLFNKSILNIFWLLRSYFLSYMKRCLSMIVPMILWSIYLNLMKL